MNYLTYKAEELALDDFFISWILKPDEKNTSFWEKYLVENPEEHNKIQEAAALIKAVKFTRYTPSVIEVEKNWNLIQINLRRPMNTSKRGKAAIFKIAASFILLLGFGYLLYFYAITSTLVAKTGFMETKTVRLPDGSSVVLNSNSVICYSPNWNNEEPREVWLQGEGFFNVTHKANNQKFIITTSANTKIEVLGTSFNLLSRRTKTSVALNTGKVKIAYEKKGENKEIYLIPGEVAEISQNGRLIHKKVKPEIYSSWKKKKWILTGQTLNEVIVMIEDQLGWKVRLKNKEKGKQEIVGSVPTNNILDVIEVISATCYVKASIKDQTIIFE